MVATAASLAADSVQAALPRLVAGLPESQVQRLTQAVGYVTERFEEMTLETGEPIAGHVLAVGLLAAELKLDAASRLAALLYPLPTRLPECGEWLEAFAGSEVLRLVRGLERLNGLRLPVDAAQHGQTVETLRRMLLAFAEDVRVVLLRLASRVATLRWFVAQPALPDALAFAEETQALYAPLANRLGMWRLKWELEDLAFRLREPTAYKTIAKALEERRLEREAFIAERIAEVTAMVERLGIAPFEVAGRPKHIYSIYLKMQRKGLDFARIYDVRALRVLVPRVEDCYAVLAAVHERWPPIPGEFDDYIARPKPNGYQSLHTAVYADDGRPLEVQVRTFAMHRDAELGVAAHWRYKEGAAAPSSFDEKIALLRSLLAWREEVAEQRDLSAAIANDAIYVLTPGGRVVDLPVGATPIDFAYRVHTDVGHRCRGAKVDGKIVPLNTPLATGQTVEILTAKTGGPSRDWLQPGFAVTRHARQKIRAWFLQQELEAMLVRGRLIVDRELARLGKTRLKAEALAQRLGFKDPESLFRAAARGEVGPKAIGEAASESLSPATTVKTISPPPTTSSTASAGTSATYAVLVVGERGVLTQRARCCSPGTGDAIAAFVSRTRGITIHRADCAELQRLIARFPERVLPADWEPAPAGKAGV